MADLILYAAAVVVDSEGNRQAVGSVLEPVVLSSAIEGRVYRAQLELEDDATGTLWDAAAGPLEDFDFLWICANQDDVELQLTVGDGQGGEENVLVELKKGVPFILGADDSYRNYVADFGGGDPEVIDKIMCNNESGDVAVIEILAVT